MGASPRSLLACALACAYVPAGAGAAGTALAATTPPATLIVEGAGDGHGVGMSQDGALGYAQHGFSDTQILTHYYTGTTIGMAPANASVKVLEGKEVVKVSLERYVRGVVAEEMPSSWPMAALEAQAIASRTYALTTDAGGSRFDVYADTRSQVYAGVKAETAQTNAAITSTAGQIVLYEGAPATTYYFASSGGMTEDIQNSFIGAASQPWLQAVPDAYETSASKWRTSMSFHAAAVRLAGLFEGSFRGIEVLERGVSPRIVMAKVLGSRGDRWLTGPQLAARLGLTSTWAYFSVRSGTSVKSEPDVSGHAPFVAPAAEAPPASTPATQPATGAGGGAQAPAVLEAGKTGGAQAGP